MLSFELASQKTHHKSLETTLFGNELDIEKFEAYNFKRILSSTLDGNELKEFEKRLENNNIFEEENENNPETEKHISFLQRLKFLFKK